MTPSLPQDEPVKRYNGASGNLYAENPDGIYVLASDFDKERAQRLEVEGELARAVEEVACLSVVINDPSTEIARLKKELLELRAKVGQQDLGRKEVIARWSNRGEMGTMVECDDGEYIELDDHHRATVSLFERIRDLGGNKAKADGGTKPTSAKLFARGDWPEDSSHENGNYFCKCYVCGRTFTGYKRRVVCKVCHTEREEALLASSEAEKGQAPSPEPAAIPKTRKAREWWIDPHERLLFDEKEPYAVHVREVTGEGRKVSEEAWTAGEIAAEHMQGALRDDELFYEARTVRAEEDAERELRLNAQTDYRNLVSLLMGRPCIECNLHVRQQAEEIIENCYPQPPMRRVSPEAIKWLEKFDSLSTPNSYPFARELLCILSEEGGRQKEGQGDAAGRPAGDAEALNPQNKSDL